MNNDFSRLKHELGLSPCELKLKNLTTGKTKTHLCDSNHQKNKLSTIFKQTGNYEVIEQ